MATPLRAIDPVPDALSAAPARPEDRTTLIDALRGFALFGVCLGNIATVFAFWGVTGSEAVSPRWLLPTDDAAMYLYHALIDGKFYSIFSLLFGLGFALQLGPRIDDPTALARFRRRLRVLMGIGLAHLLLLWMGDILLFYALMGLVLVRLRHLDDRRVVRWAAILLALPVVSYLPTVISPALSPATPLFIVTFGVAKVFGFDLNSPTLVFDNYVNGDLFTFLKMNATAIWFRYADLLWTGRPFKVLAMFLLGMLIGRRRAWEDVTSYLPLLRRVLAWGVGIGLPACLTLAAIQDGDANSAGSWHGVLESALYTLGVAPLALGYAAGFVLLWQRPAWKRWLGLLAPTGRMALTNYLTQTVIGITIFYGVGFGLGGRIGPSYFAPMALSILVLQTMFSQWWLARYRFGPMEWLWRSITYRQRQPMRI